MNQHFFEFTRQLCRKDRTLMEEASEEQAYIITCQAYEAFADTHYTIEEWIDCHYPTWIKRYVFVSETMSDRLKEILTKRA